MGKLSSSEFVDSIGIKVPEAFLDESEEFDPLLAEVLKAKIAPSVTWEELQIFFENNPVPPEKKHQLAKDLNINPRTINRARGIYRPPKKKKWNVLRKAKAHLDPEMITDLKIYLGIGLKAEIRASIDTVVGAQIENEITAPIDLEDPLLDILYKYLAQEIRTAEEEFDGSGELDLRNLGTTLPYLVVETTRENVNQATLPL